jgi:hypothetical protein
MKAEEKQIIPLMLLIVSPQLTELNISQSPSKYVVLRVNIRIACQILLPSSNLLKENAVLRGCFLKQTSTAFPWVELTFCSNATFNLLFETKLITYHANCSYRCKPVVIAR